MLVIRTEQMAAFRDQASKQFDRHMVDYLYSEHPALTQPMGRDAVFDLIRRARFSASQYRIEKSGALALWIELWLMYGDELKRSPDRAWAQNILRHPVLPDYIRVERVRERLFATTGGRAVAVSNVSSGS